jgi:hypothetical protein
VKPKSKTSRSHGRLKDETPPVDMLGVTAKETPESGSGLKGQLALVLARDLTPCSY